VNFSGSGRRSDLVGWAGGADEAGGAGGSIVENVGSTKELGFRVNVLGISSTSVRRVTMSRWVRSSWALILFRRRLSSFIRAKSIPNISDGFIEGRSGSVGGS
jgi:hypothetical protein